MLYDTPTQADEELQAARDCSSWPAIPSNDREWNSVRTSSGRCSRYSSIARCSVLSATVRRETLCLSLKLYVLRAPGHQMHDTDVHAPRPTWRGLSLPLAFFYGYNAPRPLLRCWQMFRYQECRPLADRTKKANTYLATKAASPSLESN